MEKSEEKKDNVFQFPSPEDFRKRRLKEIEDLNRLQEYLVKELQERDALLLAIQKEIAEQPVSVLPIATLEKIRAAVETFYVGKVKKQQAQGG